MDVLKVCRGCSFRVGCINCVVGCMELVNVILGVYWLCGGCTGGFV